MAGIVARATIRRRDRGIHGSGIRAQPTLSHRADRSWEICQNFLNLFAAQRRGIRTCRKHRHARDSICHDFDLVWPLLPGRQYNPSTIDAGVQWITGANAEPATQRAWENNLPFGRNFGLHGKTILPCWIPANTNGRNRGSQQTLMHPLNTSLLVR